MEQSCPLIRWSCRHCLSFWVAGLNLTVLLAQISGNSLWHSMSFCETTMWSPRGICLPLALPYRIPSHFSSSDHLRLSLLTSLANWWLEMRFDWSIASTSPPLMLQRGRGWVSNKGPSPSGKQCHVLKEAECSRVYVWVKRLLFEYKFLPCMKS